MWNYFLQKKIRSSKLISCVTQVRGWEKNFVDNEVHASWFQSTARASREMSVSARRQGHVRAKNDLSARLRHSSFSNIRAINGYRRRGESRENEHGSLDRWFVILLYFAR